MQYIFYILSLITISIFICCVIFVIYLAIIFITSKGLKISPTVTSSSKSINYIAEYIKEYLKHTNKKNIRILDIGSGYGTMLFKINKLIGNIGSNSLPSIEFVGYEISKFAYLISKIRNKYNNIKLINDDINNLKDFDFDIVITFILAKQQKQFLDIYRKFPKNTIIIANSLRILFEEDDDFQLVKTINVHYGWNIYIYGSKSNKKV